MTPRAYRITLSLVLPFVLACAGQDRVSELDIGPKLTSADQLEQIAAMSVGELANADSGQRVSLWQLVEPLPDMVGVGPALADSPGEQLAIAAAARDSRFVVDEQLTCAAHQLAEFIAEQGKPPTRALLRHMFHRCGSITPIFGWGVQAMAGPPQLADFDALAERTKFSGGALGLWAVQRGPQWLLVGTFAQQRTRIEPLPMVVERGQVRLEGMLDGPRDWVMGYTTQGERGIGVCQVVTGSAGRFRMICPVSPTDESAFVDVFAAQPGRLLGNHEARIWVSPNRALSPRYVDPAKGRPPTPISGPIEAEFLAVVNEARQQAGAAPLQLSEAQSASMQAVRPQYRMARGLGDGAQIDEIALGLMAGWDIEAPILDAAFAELELEAVAGREHVLEAALSQPTLRAILLDPRASLIGLTIDPGAGNDLRSGMFSTYILAERGDRDADTQWLREYIELYRSSRKLPTTSELDGAADILAARAQRIAVGANDLDQGLEAALHEIAMHHAGREIQGGAVFVQDIRKIKLPAELLASRALDIAVHVELVESKRSAWASLMIMFAFSYR